MKTSQTPDQTTMYMDKNVDAYISKQKSPQKEICQKLRQILFETFPDISEEMKWGVPAYDHGKYYFVSLKTHVNLGFSLKGLSKEEIALFEGNGKTMRHLKIQTVQEIDKKKIVNLLRLVKEKS